jgi:HEAT repeat protein
MSDVRWKVSLLFAIITLSIFFSIYWNSDGILESIGNQTRTQAGEANASNSSVLNKAQIPDLIYKLETGNNDTKLDAASKLGRLGKPAANALVEEIETNNSSLEGPNNYMLLALLETGDERAENILSENIGKKVASNNTTAENTAEGKAGKIISEDTLQALKAKDKDMRKRLADSIDREYGNKTDALENALKSEEQNSSIYTPFAFSEFGPQEPGSETEKLIKALKSGNGSIRIAAMMALGESKEKAAVNPLNDILLRDYPLAKNGAIIALGDIGDEGAVEILLKQMQSDSEFTRSNIAIALGKIGTEKALPNLLARLRDVSAGVRSNSALALARIGNETAVDPLIGVLESGKGPQGKAQDSTNANADVRKSAILALGELGDTRATDDLIGILTDKEEKNDVRIAAASALGEIGASGTAGTLKGVIDDNKTDNRIKKKALLALGKTKNQEVVGILVGKLGNNEFGATAREALVYMGEIAVDPLIENLKTADKRIKNEIALILIEIGDPRAVKPLILAYQ